MVDMFINKLILGLESSLGKGCLIFLPVVIILIMLFLKNRIKMIIIGLVILGFGYLVYLKHPSDVTNHMEAFSSALSSFFPSRGQYDRECVNSVCYWIFHVCAIVYVSAIIVALFGIESINRIRLRTRRVLGMSVNVFWGYSDEAKIIASGVDEGKGSVVFVMPERRRWTSLCDNEDIHEVAWSGWKWILGRPGGVKWLSSAKRHFFIGRDGHKNVEDAEALIRSYRGLHTISVYVRIGATADDDVLFKWADKWNKEKNVEVVIVREESLVSRRLLFDNPMLCCPGIAVDTSKAVVSGDFKVLLLGFGSQGKMLLNDIICDSQYLDSSGNAIHFEAHVFDQNILAYGEYEELCQDAVSRYNINFECIQIGSALFWQRFKAEMKKCPYNRVVVCMRDDRENIRVATNIAHIYKGMNLKPNNIVFARIRNSLIDAYVESTFGEDVSKRMFTSFGAMRDTYSFGNIVTRKWEKGAVWINGDWGIERDEEHDEAKDIAAWKSTSFFNKESSRASFFYQRNILRLIGYKVDETSDDNTCFNEGDRLNHLEVLAENEHLRWMAFHFVRGIKTWTPSKEEIREVANRTGKKVKHNMIESLNAHADLVPYKELPKVDELFNQVNEEFGYGRGINTQDKDKGFIRCAAMKCSGLGIRKW